MRRAVSVLRSRALGWRSEATLSDGAKTTSRGMAMAALDDDCFFYSSSRRSSLDAAAAPSASSSSSSSVAFPTSSSSTPSSVRSAHTSAPAASAAASAAAAAAATTSPRFFITGARGQIGIELTRELAKTHGAASIVASDLPAAVAAGRALPGGLVDGVHYVACDVTDREGLSRAVAESGATHIIHLAAMLSAAGERNPAAALAVNAGGTSNVLSCAAAQGAHNGTGTPAAVMAPSTIAVYGCPPAPRDFCGDDAVQRPTTMYGLTKAHQELLGEYYFKKAGVDYRSFRLPGVISADAPPGGGTTDYACAIFAAALTTKKFDCYLSADAELPFAHMEDVLSGAARLLQAPGARLSRRTYSVSGFSATPAQWAGAVAARVPGFKVSFSPDFRDGIARSWPASLDDSNARRDWGWNPLQGLEPTTDAMLARVDSILRSSDEAARAWGVPPLRGRSVVVGGMAAAAAASTTTTSLSAAP